jgi:hypothetical protein
LFFSFLFALFDSSWMKSIKKLLVMV